MSDFSTHGALFEVDLDGNPVAGLRSGQASGLVAALTLIVAVGAAVIGYVLGASGTSATPGSTIALEAAPSVGSQPLNLHTGPDGTRWTIANGKLWRFNDGAWTTPIEAGPVTLKEMAFDVAATLWVTDGHGVWRIVGDVLEEKVTADGGRLVDVDQGTIVSFRAHPDGGLVAEVAEWNIAQPEIWWLRDGDDGRINEMPRPFEFTN